MAEEESSVPKSNPKPVPKPGSLKPAGSGKKERTIKVLPAVKKRLFSLCP